MMKKIIGACVLLTLFATNVSAEQLPELDSVKVSGYYFSDEIAMVLLPNGKAYNVTDVSKMEELDFSVTGTVDDFILELASEEPVYFHHQNEKDGTFYAAYLDNVGTVADTDYVEGKHVLYGDYVFDNDYSVFEKSSVANFFGIEYSDSGRGMGSVEGTGYSTPYDAANAFITGFQNNSLDQMETAFAIETFAENVDVEAFIERIRSYNPTMGWIPNDNEFAVEMNVAKRHENVLSQIRYLYLAATKCKVTVGEEAGMSVMYKDDEQELSEFISDLFPGNKELMKIEFERLFIDPADLDDNFTNEINQTNIVKQSEYYHPEEVQPVVAVLKINNVNYVLMMDTCRYGEKWYVANLGGFMGSLEGVAVMEAGLVEIPNESVAEAMALSKNY